MPDQEKQVNAQQEEEFIMTVSSTAQPEALRSEKLSFWTKAAYAIGDLGNSAGPGTVIPFWYLYFLTDVAKLDPALAGLAFSIGKLWDAVNDPLVGMLSDRTRTRWGRRRPYLLFGAIPFGLTFALLWIVPPIQNQILLCLYFAFMYMLFDTAFTLVGCPYDALTPELTLDHDERTSLTTYRMFVSIVAGLLSALVFGLFVFPAFPDPQTAFLVIGLLCGVVFIPPVLITFFGTQERAEFQAAETMSFVESLRFLLRNREWRYTVAINLLSWLPVDIATAVFAYFLVYWTGMSKDEASMVQAVILVSATLFLPLVLWMARRLEKKTTYIIATASWVAFMLAILLVPPDAKVPTYIIAFGVGLGVSSAHVLPRAMSPDVIEVDELMSGRRQEGIYSGINVFVRKLSTMLAVGAIGLVLAWSGYVENAAQQTPQALTAIRILISVVPAVILLASILIAYAYPLTRARHAEIQAELALRRTPEQGSRRAGEQTSRGDSPLHLCTSAPPHPGSSTPLHIREVTSRRDLRAFVKFPWKVYKGDPNWVPPLISERLDYLNPEKNPFFQHAEVALFLARRGRDVVGTIAPFVNYRDPEYAKEKVGGFGFFEVIEDYAVAERLLDTARDWVRARGMAILRGPTNFGRVDTPGVLIEGADCPPVMLATHTPPYYKTFLERYGMEKYNDRFAWRAFRSQIGAELENLPPELLRVAEAARQRAGVTIRKARLDKWDEEVRIAHYLFNATLQHLNDYVPMSEAEFRRFADQMRPLLDPDLILFAEVDGKPVGFCGAIPDINRALIHLNGRLFPFGWLKLWWYMRRIDVVSFKLMGVLEEYRRRGIDALLYMETIKAVFAKGYQWLDGSLTSEFNLMVNFLASRLGAERYKHYRIYQIQV